MQTLREVLGRDEERGHLINGGLCILVVIVLVAAVFAVTHLEFFEQGLPNDTVETQVPQPAQDDG